MENRRSERKTVHLKAERISGDTSYAVFIENISEYGINIITAPAESGTNFIPGASLDLKLQLSSEETINLHCRVRWLYQNTPPDNLTNSIGIEIIDPPLRYKEFVKKLL